MPANKTWIPETTDGTNADIVITKKVNLQQALQKQGENLTPNLIFHKTMLLRFVLENIYTLLLQYSGLMISVLLPLPAPISFAAGTACGFIFLRGFRVLPGIFLGSWFALLATNPWPIAIMAAALYSSYIGLLYANCLYYRWPSLIFYRTRDLKFFFLLCLSLSSLYCVIGTYYFEPPWTDFYKQWLFTTLANLNGILLFATAILMWDARSLEFMTWQPKQQRTTIYAMSLILIIIAASLIILQPSVLLLGFILFLSTLFVWRFKPLFTLVALCLFATACNFAHYFNVAWLQQQTPLNLIVLQAIIVILMLGNTFRITNSKFAYAA